MKKKYLGKTIGSLLIVLLMMPLGHALMILMEHFLEPTTLHYSAFLMGFVGLVITIAGVFVKGDTRQTCFGLAGALDRLGGVFVCLLCAALRRSLRPCGQRRCADHDRICQRCRRKSYVHDRRNAARRLLACRP